MKTCVGCGRQLPTDKFNQECGSPDHCFRCRVTSINLGFGGNKQAFHGDTLVGGTIRADNEYTVKTARANGHDPVPVHTRESAWVPSSNNINKLKTALGG